MIFITGDCHGGFQRFGIKYFPLQRELGREDFMIVCGDYAVKNIMPREFEIL